MASSSTRMDDVEDDFSVDNLYKETMAGEWKEVVRNNDGESPLFLAAYHGEKTSSFASIIFAVPPTKALTTKATPPTEERVVRLYCAIRWEYIFW